MVGRLVPVQVGGVEVLVEARPVAGSEPTSGRLEAAAGRAVEAFDKAQETITAIAERVAGTVGELARRSARPDRMEVEFGLSFTASGNVIVAGSTVEATLKITVAYERRDQVPVPAAADAGSAVRVG